MKTGNIRFKLLLILIPVILLIQILFLFILNSMQRKEILSSNQASTKIITEEILSAFDLWMRNQLENSRLFSTDPRITEYIKDPLDRQKKSELSQFLINLKYRYPYYEEVFISVKIPENQFVQVSGPENRQINLQNGDILISTSDAAGQNSLDNLSVKEVFNGNDHFIGDPQKDIQKDEIYFIFSHPIRSSSKQISGSLNFKIRMDYLAEMIFKENIIPNGILTLMDSRSLFLFHPDTQKILNTDLAENYSPLIDKILQYINYFEYKINHKNYIISSSRLNHETFHLAHQWYVISIQNKEQVLQKVSEFMFKMLFFQTILTIFTVIFIYFSLRAMTTVKVTRPLKLIQKKMKEASEGALNETISYHSNDEIGMIAEQANALIQSLRNSIGSIKNSIQQLNGSVLELSSTAKEVNSTALNQSSAVNEAVRTMEESNKISDHVQKQVSEVADLSRMTKKNVDSGLQTINNTKNQMDTIQNSNQNTIQGIKDLGNQIEKIWEIVNIINNIADQTKIIAFNAELEASGAGKSGQNFEIVASEIRRLADSTVHSTKDIKSRISEIQNSAHNLIDTSEKERVNIMKGTEFTENLDNVFKDILHSADHSSESSDNIYHSVKKLVTGYHQILETLKQIAESTTTFTQTTNQITGISSNIQNISDHLEKQSIHFNTDPAKDS